MSTSLQESPDQAKVSPEKKLRLLVVDDNENSAQTIVWLLETMGHETYMAFNGAEAITLASKLTPHVIFLDIGLPGMNGYEVCQRLRQLPELKDTLFVAQTGWSKDEHREMSVEAGFDHYLVKPIEIKDLETLLENINPIG